MKVKVKYSCLGTMVENTGTEQKVTLYDRQRIFSSKNFAIIALEHTINKMVNDEGWDPVNKTTLRKGNKVFTFHIVKIHVLL